MKASADWEDERIDINLREPSITCWLRIKDLQIKRNPQAHTLFYFSIFCICICSWCILFVILCYKYPLLTYRNIWSFKHSKLCQHFSWSFYFSFAMLNLSLFLTWLFLYPNLNDASANQLLFFRKSKRYWMEFH